jgi:hypothetical protein
MSLYEVWRVDCTFPLRVETLARIRAKHQPDAMLKASKRWPKLADEQRLTVRSVKGLNTLSRRKP